MASQVSDKVAKKIMAEVQSGKTYQSIADKYGITVTTVYRSCLRSGQKPGWKTAQRWATVRAKQRILHTRVKIELNKTPNLRYVCKKLGANYWNIATHEDFCLRNMPSYRLNRIKFLESKRPIHSDLISAHRKKVK